VASGRRKTIIPFAARLLGALALLLALAAPAHAASHPLQTALSDHGELTGPDADLALSRARAAGATAYRTVLFWYQVAPVERPPGFDPANPADPAYHWDTFDLEIRRIVAHGLQPLVTVNYPPVWAGGGYAPTPDVAQFGLFMKAAAERYSGTFAGLPRIRYWQAWNEPNVNSFLDWEDLPAGAPPSAASYRQLVNAAAAAVKGVHPDNVVIAGGLSPFGTTVEQADGRAALTPLNFMRDVLCLSNGSPPVATCNEPITFDAWSVHPYTRGGPTHRAESPGDTSLGDIATVRQILDAAVRAKHIVSAAKPRIWVTEFSWDTNPPDPAALPMTLHARWTAEALYRMWGWGVDLVTWLQLRDAPYPEDATQAGLYFRGGAALACDRPKLTLTAFKFPFVALAERRGALVWGRTPGGARGAVTVETLKGRTWRRLARVQADRYGIFTRHLRFRATKGSFAITHVTKQSYPQVVSCDGARPYWRLGDAAGATVAHDETGTADGAYGGGAAPGAAGAVADSTGAVTLNGGDSRVSLGPLGYLGSVELWLKTTATNAVAFSNRNDVSHFVYIGSDADGKAFVFDSAPLTSAQPVNDGRWHQLVYTYDGKTGRLYVDGALAASADYARIEGGAPAYLGYDATLKNGFTGSLDEVAVYGGALTPAQVKTHFDAAAKGIVTTDTTRFSGPYLRARSAGGTSLPFSLQYVRDRPVKPFG
jgi:hypothetical protein